MGSSGRAVIGDIANMLTTGQETIHRDVASAQTVAVATQSMRLTFFTARKSETSTQVRTISGSTAAAATPTLCRVGLYLVDGAGDGTLVASIVNDTALWATINTGYTRSWSVAYAMVAGQRYALAILCVSAGATPTFVGSFATLGSSADAVLAPRLGGILAAQADLPASFTNAGLTATGQRFYASILPA